MELKGQIQITLMGIVYFFNSLNIKKTNPQYSGIMTNFQIELLSGTSAKVLENIRFNGNVTITPGILSV